MLICAPKTKYNKRRASFSEVRCLNRTTDKTTKQAQIIIDHRPRQHNPTRPHEALNMSPPVPETLLKKPRSVAQKQGAKKHAAVSMVAP